MAFWLGPTQCHQQCYIILLTIFAFLNENNGLLNNTSDNILVFIKLTRQFCGLFSLLYVSANLNSLHKNTWNAVPALDSWSPPKTTVRPGGTGVLPPALLERITWYFLSARPLYKAWYQANIILRKEHKLPVDAYRLPAVIMYRVGQKSKPDNFCNNFVHTASQFS